MLIVTMRFKRTGAVVRKSIEASALPTLLARNWHRIDHHSIIGTVAKEAPKRTLPLVERAPITMEET